MAKSKKGKSNSTESKQSSSNKNAAPQVVTPDNINEGEEPKNLVLAGIIIVLLLAGIGFLVFGLVQSINSDSANDTVSEENMNDENTNEGDQDADANDDADIEDDQATENNSNSDNSEENSDSSSNTGDNSSDRDDNQNTNISSKMAEKYPLTDTTYRRGNDYQFGDITGDTYVVKKGDTLWQIAEARYGSGYAWVEIDQANGVFPLLPNGQPNSIPVGFELSLPDLS